METQTSTAITALVMGMGTVFVGLALLQMAMYFSAWANNRKTAPVTATAGAPALMQSTELGTLIQPASEPALNVMTADGEPVTGELLVAIALAIHLEQHALQEMEAQRLTWTAMFRPFSPWVMDAKTSLHTRRIRWRANAAPGVIVRGRTNWS
jgi:Na+-transporting methylmalonyl-CoA/oxaloacetate decarboxylase gamma subunit